MAEPAGASEEDCSPGDAYVPYVKMNLLYIKLKLLEYDKEFLGALPTLKSIDRRYFADEVNSGEQFFMFINLASWLIRKCGRTNYKMPREHDDPNTSIASMLEELPNLGIQSKLVASKLKTGAGEQCIVLLTELADVALKKSNFSFQKPEFPDDQPDEDTKAMQDIDTENEQLQEEEYDLTADDSDEEQDDDFIDSGISADFAKTVTAPEKTLQISDTKWQQEVDRVTPSLKIVIKPRATNWRNRLQAVHRFKAELTSAKEALEESLGKLSADIGRCLETIGSREKYLNAQLEPLLSELRTTQDQLAEVKEKYREASGGVTERVKTLAQVSDELEQVKHDMKESGSRLTDRTSLLKVKQATDVLKDEITLMHVQMALNDQMNVKQQLSENDAM